MNYDNHIFSSLYKDEHGNPVERTKNKYPYSYDFFVTHKAGENEETTGTVYSDRLRQWDGEKYDKLCEKHFKVKGDYYFNRTPKQIEFFLRDYIGDRNLKLILVMEGCNVSSGYPLWRFHYKSVK